LGGWQLTSGDAAEMPADIGRSESIMRHRTNSLMAVSVTVRRERFIEVGSSPTASRQGTTDQSYGQ
jgi:hypothetical protein